MIVTLSPTAHFVVSYDDSITSPPYPTSAEQLAQGVLDYCEYDYARLCALFGMTLSAPHLPINVSIVGGGEGASNDGVATITCFLSTTTTYANGLPPLVVAEEAEIFMVAQNKGWNPGWSDGEALSRVCGEILYPSSAAGFATGSSWFNSSTHGALADWVDSVEHTDQDYTSIGCGALFLNYLAYQLNFTWPAIIGAGMPAMHTLAENATILGAAGGYAAFVNLLQNSFPSGSLYAANTPSDQQVDDVFPLGPLPAQLSALYIRHNTADDGTSHAPPLSSSPDIIMRNAAVADPQTTFSSMASVASDQESDAFVQTGQANYIYLRVWNRGVVGAQNVFADAYWSPPTTLVTPSMWNLIGTSYFPAVPADRAVEVSTIGIPWPADQIPAPGHYCFVATVGNNYQAPPDPETLANFATFQDYYDYILENNNITWRNFNVGPVTMFGGIGGFGQFVPLPFHITGAWTGHERFTFETIADLPERSELALQTADWIGRELRPAPEKIAFVNDAVTDIAQPRRARIQLSANRPQLLGEIALPAHTAAKSHLLVHIPRERHDRPYDVAIRQLYRGGEVGRITWRLIPEK